MIAAGGELDGVRVLSPAAVGELFRAHPGAGRRTLGWQAFCPAEPPGESAPCARPVAFGHVGYTGTSLWIDPESRAWLVLLSNRTYDVRSPEAMRSIGELRERVWRAALARQ
jgi:CubicO group peptidase (beta-lactamase class C family)